MSDLGWQNPSIYPIVATDGSNLKEEVTESILSRASAGHAILICPWASGYQAGGGE